MRYGVKDYVLKPVDPDTFHTTIGKVKAELQSIQMDARIRAAASGARRQVEGTPCTVMSLPCQRAVQPAPCKSSTLVSTSARCGTCRKRTVPLHKRAAASSGSTLFFGCRDVYCAVQRHAACDDKISAHAKSPRSAKDTSCYAARRLFVYYFVCSCVICLSGYL